VLAEAPSSRAQAQGQADQDTVFAKRLSDYWAARDRFIRVGMQVRPTSDVHEMLAQVREPLLDVLRTSPDFRPAYEPLVGMAMALMQQDGNADLAQARALLAELTRLQPAWPQARQALLQLPASP
jgi:spermidine synthase